MDYSIFQNLERLFQAGKLEAVLSKIFWIVDDVVKDPVFVAQIFGSKNLDQYCQQIGEEVLRKYVDPNRLPLHDFDDGVAVYLATKIQGSGGHSDVLRTLISSRPGKKHFVFLTGVLGRSDIKGFQSKLPPEIDLSISTVAGGSFVSKLIVLQRSLQKLRPDSLFLFAHHQDCIAISAAVSSLASRVVFYHHADHHFALGLYVKHFEHIDLHPMAYFNCKYSEGISPYYSPLTVADKGKMQPKARSERKELLTCTVARSNKLIVPYHFRYYDVVVDRLKVAAGKHLHIGKLGSFSLFKLYIRLILNGVSVRRFRYVREVSSVWEALHKHDVSLYISSFPYAAGLTMIEVMGAGVPMAVHNNPVSSTLSCDGLAYPECFRWSRPDELLKFLSELNADDLQMHSHLARAHYEKFYAKGLDYEAVLTGKSESEPFSDLPALSEGNLEVLVLNASKKNIGSVFFQNLKGFARRVFVCFCFLRSSF